MALKRLQGLRDPIAQVCAVSGTPGLSYGVLHEARVLQTDNFGFADLQAQTPPTSDTRYCIGSLTKAFTSAAVASLVQDGKLAWDTLVRDILGDDFHFSDSYLTQKMTILDILSHRMGLQRSNQQWYGNDNVPLLKKDDIIAHIQYLKSVQPYNSTVHYNNWGYALAGWIVEKVSGESWNSYIEKTLLAPLHMNDTNSSEQADAKPYTVLDDHSFLLLPAVKVQDGVIMDSSPGIRSTVNDMLKWCQAWLESYSNAQKTSQDTAADSPLTQITKQLSGLTPFAMPFYPRSTYGMGWVRAELPTNLGAVGCNPIFVKSMPIVGKGRDEEIFYHQVSMAGYTTSAFLIPSTQSAIVVLTNSLSLNDAADWVGQLILESLLGVDEPNDYIQYANESARAHVAKFPAMRKSFEASRVSGTEPKQLGAYVGRYYNEVGDFHLEISRRQRSEDLQLAFQGLASQVWALEHYHYDSFLWLMSRDEAVSRARFPYSPEKLYRLDFQTNDDGIVDSLLWAHDADGPPEKFFKGLKGESRSDTTFQKPLAV